MSDQNQDQEFLRRLKASLDIQQDTIDSGTRYALSQIRKNTLAQLDKRNSGLRSLHSWYPVLAATATASIIASLALTINLNKDNGVQPTLEDMPLITATDDILFYQDLEFYQWLDAEKING